MSSSPPPSSRTSDGYDRWTGRRSTGITGHAQVNLEYDSNLDDVRQKVGYDLDYIARQGFWADLWIMVRTIPVMLFRRGAR